MKPIERGSRPRQLPPFNPTPLEESGIDLAETNIDWANRFIFNPIDPKDKLSAFTTLCGRSLNMPAVCRLLDIDEGELSQFTMKADYVISPDALPKIDALHAVAKNFWRKYRGGASTDEDIARVRKMLNERTFRFKVDMYDRSADRSAVEAIIQGDVNLVLMRIEEQLGDFDDTNA